MYVMCCPCDITVARKSEQVLKDHEETFVRDAFKAKGLVSFYKCSPEVKEEFDEGFKEMPMYGRILSSILMKSVTFLHLI